jgi:hypothetical protein
MTRRRPRLLDLFCGAGGAAMGYSRAGFDVTGVDYRAMKSFPFAFVQDDALRYLHSHGADFDFIHASPPCQRYSTATAWRGTPSSHPDLVAPTRRALIANGVPWVIENVEQAPIRRDLLLCGSQFGIPIRRHRAFESPLPLREPLIPHDHGLVLPFMHKGERAYANAMGCYWMSSKEGRQAIPPVYTEYIGAQLI